MKKALAVAAFAVMLAACNGGPQVGEPGGPSAYDPGDQYQDRPEELPAGVMSASISTASSG